LPRPAARLRERCRPEPDRCFLTQVESAADTQFFTAGLAAADPEIAAAVARELHRQQSQIELIASENIVSRAVLEAQGSVLTNKYAEGYPGRRYYGGCAFVDIAESLAIERAKRLFDCGFANVQPHAGAPANEAVYLALLSPGDAILGMSLAAGGHLTHGAKPNISGKWFDAHAYGVRAEDGRIDFDEVEREAGSPTGSAPISWSTWRISPGSSRAGCIRAHCRTRMS
jgi:glycine hydroxymethyltransferase